jgi:phosphoglycolate phosphatase
MIFNTPTESVAKINVFCDFDGPIVDVSERYYMTYQLGLEQTREFYQTEAVDIGTHILSKEQFWHMKQERVADREIAMRSGLHGEQIDYFLAQVTEIVNQPFLLNKDRMQPGINWALALLHSQKIKLVLVTLREQEQVMQILSNYGLLRLFTGVYGSNNLQSAYENSAEAKTALLSHAIADHYHSGSAWMIGDTEADMIAGNRLGINTIAVTCGIRSKSYLKRFNPTYIKSDLLSASHYLLGLNQLVYS